MSDEAQAVPEQYFTSRLVQTEQIRFRWEIPQFKNAPDHKTESWSDFINLEVKGESTYKLDIQVYNRVDDSCRVSLQCKTISGVSDGSDRFGHLEVKAINDRGDGDLKTSKPKRIPFWTSVPVVEFINPPLMNGSLVLIGKLIMCERKKESSSPSSTISDDFERLAAERLEKDLNELFQQKVTGHATSADIEFHTNDGTVIPAHRTILAARNEYFRKMLNSGMAEQTTGKIDVEGISGKAMKFLVQFLYTGRLQKDWSDAETLLDFTKAAHFYQVQSLVQFLNENVAKVCDGRSVEKLLILCKRLEMKTAAKELRRLIIKRLEECCDDEDCDDFLMLMGQRKNAIS